MCDLYDLALRHHGATDPGLWLGYYRFCQAHAPDRAAQVHWRASKELDDADAFAMACTL